MIDLDKLEFKEIKINNIPSGYFIEPTGTYVLNGRTKKFVKPTVDSKLTHSVILCIDGKMYHRSIHRLVYETFVGPIQPGMTIDHLNEDRNDNRVENLEQVSRSENIQRYIRNHNITPYMKKYSDEIVENICKELKSGFYFKDVAIKYEVPMRFVENIARGNTRRSISSKYLPFPIEAVNWQACRRIPTNTLEKLIYDGYSNEEIGLMMELDIDGINDEYLNDLRNRIHYKYRNHHTREDAEKIENLILSGKSNSQIYKIFGVSWNKSLSWLIARIRHRLQIQDYNSEGISLLDQELIMDDIRAGLSNSEIEKKWKLERTPYIIHMEARLRQKVKKFN